MKNIRPKMWVSLVTASEFLNTFVCFETLEQVSVFRYLGYEVTYRYDKDIDDKLTNFTTMSGTSYRCQREVQPMINRVNTDKNS